ncbi:MAG: hypothetical protein IPN69_16440 [Acidobacteria bacterium]|nr:hypothetical protein [Acidobacteriota bacterium]
MKPSEMKRAMENAPSKDKLDLAMLIGAITRRPQMYTGYTDLRYVAVYLEGFAYAKDETSKEIRGFNQWLAERLNFPRNWAWWDGLLQAYPDSEDALRELSRLFKEFKEPKGTMKPASTEKLSTK